MVNPIILIFVAVLFVLAIFAAICIALAASRPAVPSSTVSAPYYAKIFLPEEMQEGYLRRYSIEKIQVTQKKRRLLTM